MASPLQLGRIVWAEIADPQGNRKLRPALIVTPSDQITDKGSLNVVAITSRLPQRLPDDHVLLPWHPKGHARTGLNRKCAAVCSWLSQILPNDIHDVGGIIPGRLLVEILGRIQSCSAASGLSPTEGPKA